MILYKEHKQNLTRYILKKLLRASVVCMLLAYHNLKKHNQILNDPKIC